MAAPVRVLVVDDDESMCELLVAELSQRGFDVSVAGGPRRALEALGEGSIDVVITDLKMDEMNGVELCERILAARPDVPVIVLTGHADVGAAVAALRVRAFDFLAKPPAIDTLVAAIERALCAQPISGVRAPEPSAPQALPGAVGESPLMRELARLVERVAGVDASVLIRGESGTGKDLVARAIHEQSARKGGPFVALNCAAIPEGLLEAELFGHTRGAFTDARAARAGLFEMARGGTLFLDEIAELGLTLQPKLLRALQERAIRPVGSEREVEIDVRLVTATNADLAAAVEERRFRADLYYRLDVVEVVVPPLRERGGDVLLLAQHFLEQSATAMRRHVVGFTPPCAAKLAAYPWPGNVRELANVVERAVALTRASRITVEDLPARVRAHDPGAAARADTEALVPLEELERRHIRRVMRATGGNKSLAARILGVDRRTLYRKDWAERDDAAPTNGASSAPASAPAPLPDPIDPPSRGVLPRSEAATALLEKFIAHRKRDAGTIRASLEGGDFETISRIAHNMRGNGMSYGFPEIGSVGERMEVAAEQKDTTGVHDALVALDAWVLEVTRDGARGAAPRTRSGTRVRADGQVPGRGNKGTA